MSEVIVVPTIEKVEEVSSIVGTEKVVNPITAKVLELVAGSKQPVKAIYTSMLVEEDKFKSLMIALGLYETVGNTEEIAILEKTIATVKATLLAAGFDENHEITKGAIKGSVAELAKASAKVVDNLPQLTAYFGVKSGKTVARSNSMNGDLATYRPQLAELKTTDYVFNQLGKSAIVVHSSTVSEKVLTTLKVKADSQLWLSFEYNSVFAFERLRHADNDGKMIATVKTWPENYVSVKSVVYEGITLSGLMGKVARSLDLTYSGNGWQSCSMLVAPFDKIERVVKA